MPVTIVNRPYGHKLIDTVLSATVSDASGDALITTLFTHALSDGDYIYIQGDLESLNGYKYVDAISSTTFKVRNGPGDNAVEYSQDATISYQTSVDNHGWLAAHLPIVYELKSDLWPENILEESYTPVTVVSFSNNNGYTQVTLSGAITTPVVLTYITIGGESYQIIEVSSSTVVTINLAYDVDNDLSGAVLKYYNNYSINVEVWLGLSAGHRWVSRKPYTLITTLSLIPDSNNSIKFSISEIVRSYINTRNNLALDTLPNNLDFYTGFYIVFSESYEISDGLILSRYTSPTNNDKVNFEGHAVNAKLPFKSVAVNSMSEYINNGVYLAKWLVLQSRPIAIVGKFFDMSFINSVDDGSDILIIINGELNQTIVNPGIGVIRVPLDFISAGEYCVYAMIAATPPIPPVPPPTLQIITAWVNAGVYPSLPWAVGSPHPWEASVNGNGGLQDYIVGTFAGDAGVDYDFTINTTLVNTGGATPNFLIRCMLLDNSFNILAQDDVVYTTYASSRLHSMTLTPSSDCSYFGITCINNTVVDTKTIQLNNAVFDGGGGSPGSPGTDAQTITETICIDVFEECDNTIIPGNDNLRLLETGEGNFRELE